MSYGAQVRRDARRKSAIPRIEKWLGVAQEQLTEAGHKAKKAKGTPDSADAEKSVYWQAKIGRLSAHLEQTKANMGKGTAAMGRNE